MAYTDYQYWQVVYRADDSEGSYGTYDPPSDDFIWPDEEGDDYAAAVPTIESAVSAVLNDDDDSFLSSIGDAFRELADVVQTVVYKLFPMVNGDASKFVCINAATIIADVVPGAGSVCVTGDGKVIVGLGFGIPGGSFVSGFTADGRPAADVLLKSAFNISVGAGLVGGVIISWPSNDFAYVAGIGTSASLIDISYTYGIQIGTIGDSVFNTNFGHEGGG